jgi:hypothetical protein
MLIRRSRHLSVQPRKYENITFGAEIEFDSSEAGKTPVEKFANDTLDRLLEDEMVEAASATQTDSFIADYRFTGE